MRSYRSVLIQLKITRVSLFLLVEAPDKRRKIGTGRMMASTTASRGRQALASEFDNIEFTKEEVDALLNERFKGKKFDSKDALDCHKRELEARMVSEKNLDSVRVELRGAEQNALIANEKAKSQEENNKRLQEYSTSLQQYNSKLQTDLKAATDANKQVESEKSAVLENLRELRSHHNLRS